MCKIRQNKNKQILAQDQNFKKSFFRNFVWRNGTDS